MSKLSKIMTPPLPVCRANTNFWPFVPGAFSPFWGGIMYFRIGHLFMVRDSARRELFSVQPWCWILWWTVYMNFLNPMHLPLRAWVPTTQWLCHQGVESDPVLPTVLFSSPKLWMLEKYSIFNLGFWIKGGARVGWLHFVTVTYR